MSKQESKPKILSNKEKNAYPIAPISKLKKVQKYYDKILRPTQEEYDSMKKDIVENGIINPLIINDEFGIIDGYSRYDIAKEIGLKNVPIRFINMASDDDVIKSQNILRRHLTPFQKVYSFIDVYYKIKEMKKVNSYSYDGDSLSAFAKIIGVSVGTVIKSVYCIENGTEKDLFLLKENHIGATEMNNIIKTRNKMEKTRRYRDANKDHTPDTTDSLYYKVKHKDDIDVIKNKIREISHTMKTTFYNMCEQHPEALVKVMQTKEGEELLSYIDTLNKNMTNLTSNKTKVPISLQHTVIEFISTSLTANEFILLYNEELTKIRLGLAMKKSKIQSLVSKKQESYLQKSLVPTIIDILEPTSSNMAIFMNRFLGQQCPDCKGFRTQKHTTSGKAFCVRCHKKDGTLFDIIPVVRCPSCHYILDDTHLKKITKTKKCVHCDYTLQLPIELQK